MYLYIFSMLIPCLYTYDSPSSQVADLIDLWLTDLWTTIALKLSIG